MDGADPPLLGPYPEELNFTDYELADARAVAKQRAEAARERLATAFADVGRIEAEVERRRLAAGGPPTIVGVAVIDWGDEWWEPDAGGLLTAATAGVRCRVCRATDRRSAARLGGALNALRRAGWRCFGGGWVCPDCRVRARAGGRTG